MSTNRSKKNDLIDSITSSATSFISDMYDTIDSGMIEVGDLIYQNSMMISMTLIYSCMYR